MSVTATLKKSDLKRLMLAGSKTPDNLQVGVEWEKIGVFSETGEAIPYSGPRGVEAIFKALIGRFGWNPVFSSGHIIALLKNDSSITLEPGGQIELSGQKAHALDDNRKELETHLREIQSVSEPLGITWLGLGLQPFSGEASIEWVPKERYRIMRERLKKNGLLTTRMMKQTASIQISLDFVDERDAVVKLRLAMALAPILSAVFANSPLSEGKISPYLSARAHIWLHTAPERTGILPAVFNPGFTMEDYVDYALGVPALFIVRNNRWVGLPSHVSFREFLEKGAGPHTATPEDWALHLTTIFTEARLKSYLEIRCMDCQNAELGLAAPAFLKGLFYNPEAGQNAWKLLDGLTIEERLELSRLVPAKGLSAPFKKSNLLELSKKLLEISEHGLNPPERKYLRPLKELLEQGCCPAEILKRHVQKLEGERLVREVVRRTAF